MLPPEDKKSISFAAIKITQPIGTFFIASISARDLYNIAFFDIRRRINGDKLEEYMGIQRTVSEKRVNEISAYVTTVDATFPTSVVLAVDEQCATIEPLDCGGASGGALIYRLTLSNVNEPEEGEDPILFRQIARVLDGQHRIRGLEDHLDTIFDVNVAIFVGLDIASQASIFSVVNLAQTKVNPSLVYDLFEYNKARSPEKTCHDVAVALDKAASSPFYERIKRLGVTSAGRFGETLSQATFVRGLLPHISNDVVRDRDLGRRGKIPPPPSRQESEKFIFRKLYIEERDLDIAETLWAYFSAVEEKWPRAWKATGRGRILNKTTGFQALMKFLRPAFLHVAAPGEVPKQSSFSSIFAQSTIGDDDFTTSTYSPGSSGTALLFEQLVSQTQVRR
jgi:DGQHR domain-containing protein